MPPFTSRIPRLTRVSDGNPFRRLLVRSKGLLAVARLPAHRHTLRSSVSVDFEHLRPSPPPYPWRTGGKIRRRATLNRRTPMNTRDARIQKWAVITFAIVEAVIIAAVLWFRRG